MSLCRRPPGGGYSEKSLLYFFQLQCAFVWRRCLEHVVCGRAKVSVAAVGLRQRTFTATGELLDSPPKLRASHL